jgi:hypothetical protein
LVKFTYLQKLDRNWRSGKFTENSVLKKDYFMGGALDMDDDYVSMLGCPPLIFERTNMTLAWVRKLN